ncbi:cold shock domain-containing protein (plasmid) [Rhodococcus sp. USK10]|nr:cold shock domain-containing protein [Rhodococcus sp. USK10]
MPTGGCWVHFREVEIDGFRKLDPGQEVDFERKKRLVR